MTKICSELHIVGAEGVEKAVAAELKKTDGDINALLKELDDEDERKDVENNTESM